MKLSFRLLVLFSSLILIFSLAFSLVSCSGPEDPPTDVTTVKEDISEPASEETTSEVTTEGEIKSGNDEIYNIVKAGKSEFRIIRPTNKNVAGEAADSVVKIKNAIKDLTSTEIRIYDDFLSKGAEYDNSTYEILVGRTEYAQSKDALGSIAYGDYIITVSGHKIIINAWCDEVLKSATDAFIKIIENSVDENKDLSIKAEDLKAKKTVIPFGTLGITSPDDPGFPEICDCNNGTKLMVFGDKTEEDFNSLKNGLVESGYALYDSHKTGNVSFATFTNEDYILNVFYEEYYKDIRMIIEDAKTAALPPHESTYVKICDSVFVQVGLEYDFGGSGSINQIGMCYIWRLEDGRFIVIDGGNGYKACSRLLINTLTALAPNPDNIVIACWIFTHGHGDHIGSAVKYFQNYKGNFKVESVLLDMPSDEQTAVTGEGSWDTLFPLLEAEEGLVIHKAQPGEIYQFANATFEVLYTLEMYSPRPLDYYNTSSLVIRFSFGEFDMMMLGDCSEPANEIIRRNYGSELQSEFLQVAHHGYKGGSTALYILIDPTFVCWPTGVKHYGECRTDNPSNRNYYFFANDTNIDELYVAGDDVIIFTIENDVGFTGHNVYESMEKFLTEYLVPKN